MTSTPNDSSDFRQETGEVRVPLVEERAHIDVTERTTAKVRVQTRTEHIREIVGARLEADHYDVSEVEIGQTVTEPPQVRTEGDVTIVPILEEVLVVEKRLVLVRELHLRRRTVTEEVSVPVERRRQTAEIERIDGDPNERGD